MSATGLLLFIIGIWIILNVFNLVDVAQGKATLGLTKPTTGGHSVGGSW